MLAVLGARAGYHLPYFWAKMRVKEVNGAIHYASQRRWPHDSSAMTEIVIQPGQLFQSSELTERDLFLTARYRLYTTSARQLRYAQIEHAPWPLARASVLELRQTLFERAGLPPPLVTPLIHYAAELAVKIGRLI